MGFLDKLGEAVGSTIKDNKDSYNKTSNNSRLSSMSNEQLRNKAEDAIQRRDYGAAKAYADEYKSRK